MRSSLAEDGIVLYNLPISFEVLGTVFYYVYRYFWTIELVLFNFVIRYYLMFEQGFSLMIPNFPY